jgi:hypothetical protein
MNKETAWILRTTEHRGCGITAASYRSGNGDWIPEACFWLITEVGWRRLWINSFSHYFGPREATFKSKIEADNCALRIARTLIDKTLPEFDMPSSISLPSSTSYFAKIIAIARRPISTLSRIKKFKYPQGARSRARGGSPH